MTCASSTGFACSAPAQRAAEPWRTGEPNNISDVEEPYLLAAAVALLRQERGLDAAEIASQVGIPTDLMEAFVVDQRPRLRVAPPLAT